jgi:hypothetical protein
MEILSKLFGSETKVKMMRLFLFNPDKVFDAGQIADRVNADVSKVRRELGNFEKMNLVKVRASSRAGAKKGYHLDPQFAYLTSLQNFLINVEPLQPKEIIKRVGKLGAIKLIIISGVFMQEPESRLDLLVVGDNVKKAAFEHVVKILESEIGKELRYAFFTTTDFQYRLNMFDKLTRDVLDYPHRKLINKLGNI